MKNIIFIFCFSLISLIQSQEKHSFIENYYTNPLVHIAGKENFSFTIKTNNLNIVSIRIPFNPSPYKRNGVRLDTLQLYNDGTHGDKLANDSLFTIDDLVMNQYNLNSPTGYWYFNSKEIIYYLSNGEKIIQKELAQFLVLWVNGNFVQIPGIKFSNEKIIATDYVVSILHKNEANFPHFNKNDRILLNDFYKIYKDEFDFAIIPVLFPSEQLGGSHLTVSNNVNGTGLSIFNNSYKFGSTGSLLGIINIFYQFNNLSLINHEILHQWAVHTDKSLMLNKVNDSHWGILEMESSGFGTSDIVKEIKRLTDTTFYTIEHNPLSGKCSSLEIYLAGFYPIDSVKFPIKILTNPVNIGKYNGNNLYKSSGLKFLSKEEFMEKTGERNPSYLDSKKNYCAAIIIPYERLLTPVELSYFDFVAREMEKSSSILNTGYTFTEFTKNHGRIQTYLSQFLNNYEYLKQNHIKDIYTNSEEIVAENGSVKNVFDNDISTYWHTEWKDKTPIHPHYIAFELKEKTNINGFEYTPRQDYENGRILDYQFIISNNSDLSNGFLFLGKFEKSSQKQIVKFPSVEGKYVKFIALSEVNNQPWASCAEFNILYSEFTKIEGIKLLENSLNQNFPNPFNPETEINYTIANSGHVTLKIYDILGKELETLINEEQNPGKYSVIFNATKYSSGVYFYKIKNNEFTETKKMILLR